MQEESILWDEEGVTKKALSGFPVDRMFMSPLNSYVEALTPKVMVFGDGAFGGN